MKITVEMKGDGSDSPLVAVGRSSLVRTVDQMYKVIRSRLELREKDILEILVDGKTVPELTEEA